MNSHKLVSFNRGETCFCMPVLSLVHPRRGAAPHRVAPPYTGTLPPYKSTPPPVQWYFYHPPLSRTLVPPTSTHQPAKLNMSASPPLPHFSMLTTSPYPDMGFCGAPPSCNGTPPMHWYPSIQFRRNDGDNPPSWMDQRHFQHVSPPCR